jgi:predicted RND superfamily exporter protein
VITTERFARWIVSRRLLLLTLTIVLSAIAAGGLGSLRFSNDFKAYFDEDNPQLQAFETLQKTYASYDTLLFVIAPANGDLFTTGNLQLIRELTEKSWQLPWAGRVDSLSNFSHIYAEDDDILIEPLYNETTLLDTDTLARIKTIALGEPDLVKRLVSEQGHVGAVNVVFNLPGTDESGEVIQVEQAARLLKAEFEQAHPGLTIYLSGMLMMNHAFLDSARRDITLLIPLALLISAFTLFFMLGRSSVTVASFANVIVTTAVTMGLAGWMGFILTPTTAIVPVVILTLVVANSVHVLCAYQDGLCRDMSNHQAIVDSLSVNLKPVMVTSGTTVIGFLSLNFNDSPPLRDLGNLAALGMVVTYVTTVILLPAFIATFSPRISRTPTWCSRFMASCGLHIVARPWQFLVGSTLLVAVLVALAPGNRINDAYLEYFDDSVPFRQATDFMTENLTGIYQLQYSVSSGESGGIQEPAYLQYLDSYVTWLRAQPEVMSVTTITDIMKRLNRTLNGDDQAWYRLPDNRQMAAQSLLLYESSLPVGLDINNLVDVDKSSSRVEVTLINLDSQELLAFNRRAEDWLATHAQDQALTPAKGASPALMFSSISETNIPSVLGGVFGALMLISLILILELRSLKLGLLSLIPNLVPVAMAFGVWSLLVGSIGMAAAVVASLTIGIIVDDTVHLLSKYQRARNKLGMNPQEALHYVIATVGNAMFVTSVVLMAGFLVLALSPFNPNAHMGILCALTIGFALLADLFLLPPLLILIEGRLHVPEPDGAETAPSCAQG